MYRSESVNIILSIIIFLMKFSFSNSFIKKSIFLLSVTVKFGLIFASVQY